MVYQIILRNIRVNVETSTGLSIRKYISVNRETSIGLSNSFLDISAVNL